MFKGIRRFLGRVYIFVGGVVVLLVGISLIRFMISETGTPSWETRLGVGLVFIWFAVTGLGLCSLSFDPKLYTRDLKEGVTKLWEVGPLR